MAILILKHIKINHLHIFNINLFLETLRIYLTRLLPIFHSNHSMKLYLINTNAYFLLFVDWKAECDFINPKNYNRSLKSKVYKDDR